MLGTVQTWGNKCSLSCENVWLMGMGQLKGGVKNEVATVGWFLWAWGTKGPNSIMKVLVK